MNFDPIRRECQGMTDRELVCALTINRADYDDRFAEIASQELAERGIDLSDYLNRVSVSRNDGEETACTIALAVDKLREDIPPWDLWVFTSCLDETLVLQKETRGWIAHSYTEDAYEASFFLETDPEPLLNRFLNLEDWPEHIGETHNLDEWLPLETSRSRQYVHRIAADLDGADLPYTVQTPAFSENVEAAFTIRVPPEAYGPARDIASRVEAHLQDLYDRAARLSEAGQPEKEIEIYDLLARLVPDDPDIFYNRGCILLELGRHEEAAEPFIEAVSLWMDDLAPARGTGPRDKPLPEYLTDAAGYLEQILEQHPGNTRIRHCLAVLAKLCDDPETAAGHYRAILAEDPADRIARAGLHGDPENDSEDR